MARSTEEKKDIPIEQIAQRYAKLRIVNPKAEKAMVRSLEKYGQLTPVVVSRIVADKYELLDGFKRLRGCRALSISPLHACILELSERAGKAVIMQLNWVGKSISNMEEALVVHSLCHEDKLAQVEIATLLGRHKSWVSRRIALVERLCDEAQNSIKLGLIPVSMGRDLIRLPRGNQETLLETISNHQLSCRDTRKIVIALQKAPPHAHADILQKPWETLHSEEQALIPADKNLNPLVNELRHKLLSCERHCLIAAKAISSTDPGQFNKEEELLIISSYKQAMVSLDQLRGDLLHAITPLEGPTS